MLTSHFPPGYWMLFRLGVIVLFIISLFSKIQNAFLGEVTLDRDKCQVRFTPYPSNPIVVSNSTTLNLVF
jgi:hypothetical protein